MIASWFGVVAPFTLPDQIGSVVLFGVFLLFQAAKPGGTLDVVENTPAVAIPERARKNRLRLSPDQPSRPSGKSFAEPQAARGGSSAPSVEEPYQLLASCRLLEFSNRLGFDLADPFSCYLENVSDFLERVAVAVAEAVA